MNVLLINGSPRGKNSNTYKLALSFLEGFKEAKSNLAIEELTLSQMNLEHCIGCFACWNKTPGECIIKDDMPQVIEKLVWADVTIWSFPLYSFNVPSIVKVILDRKLPMNLPFMMKNAASGGMRSRYDMRYKRHVIISTCGFYTTEGNYDAVSLMFNRLFGRINCENIFCAQGELFGFPELSKRTSKYLMLVKKAGKEYIEKGISLDTRRKLNTLLFQKEVFEGIANINWGVDEKTNEALDNSFVFTKRFAALYNKSAYTGRNIVLELEYTDLHKHYQLVLNAHGCQVLTNNFVEFSTKIQVPFDDWHDIICGKYSMEEAYAKQLYKVTGETDILVHWDNYFC